MASIPASQDDVKRLQAAIERLQRTVNDHLKGDHTQEIADHLREIHQDITAALSAIADERIGSESDYQARLLGQIAELRDELKAIYSDLKHSITEVELKQEYMKRFFEAKQSNRRKL
jgi:hypothetical protein